MLLSRSTSARIDFTWASVGFSPSPFITCCNSDAVMWPFPSLSKLSKWAWNSFCSRVQLVIDAHYIFIPAGEKGIIYTVRLQNLYNTYTNLAKHKVSYWTVY